MKRNIFYIVMEADGDTMEAFDASGGDDAGGDVSADPPMDTGEEIGSDDISSTEDVETGGDEMSSFDDGGGDDMGGFGDDSSDDSSSDNSDEEDDKKKGKKVADKANNILNQQLYQKFCNKNKEIEEIITNVRKVAPLLPYEFTGDTDQLINHLKTALLKGQNYVVNDFVDAGYGENLLFYQKLEALYTLLLNKIDTNLKNIKK